MDSRVDMVKQWLRDRWGWVATAGCCAIFFVNFGFMLNFSLVFIALQEEFESTATQTAWIGSIPFGFCCLCSPLVSLLIERFGHRAVVVTGTAISAAGIIVTSFMPSLPPMYFTFSFTFGLGAGLTLFGCFGLILVYFPLKNSIRAVVMPMACSNLGMFSLGPLIYLLQTRYGWRNMLRVWGSLIGVVSVPACLLTFKPPPEPNNDRDAPRRYAEIGTTRYDENSTSKDGEDRDKTMTVETGENNGSRLYKERHTGKVSAEEEDDDNKTVKMTIVHEAENKFKHVKEVRQKQSRWSLIWRILRTLTYPDVVLFACSVFGYGLVNSFVFIQMANFMLSIGHSEESGTQAVIAMGVSLMVGKVLLVLFADSAPFPKLGFFLIASVMGIAVLTCLLFVHNLIVILTMTAILGVTVMSTGDCLPYSVCNHAFGIALGTQALPIVGIFHGAGFILASLLGESLDKTGSYDMALYACIGVYALCGLFSFLVPVHQKCFVKDRFTMDISVGWKKTENSKEEKKRAKPTWNDEEVTYEIIDHVSTV